MQKIILIRILIAAMPFTSFAQANISADTLEFLKGTGLRQTTLWLYPNGSFKTFFFCDICPGHETHGKYISRNDSIFLIDTISFTYNPHFSSIEDTVISFEKISYVLAVAIISEKLVLYNDEKLLKAIVMAKDERLYTSLFLNVKP